MAANPGDCFKLYDIRGRVPEQLDATLAYRVGKAFPACFGARTVALGGDARASTGPLLAALARGLSDAGCQPLGLGLSTTEEVYFAAQQEGVEGGIMVTASHNPADYNGMKLVRKGAIPVSGDSGLRELEAMVAGMRDEPSAEAHMPALDLRRQYVDFLLSACDVGAVKPLRVVMNAGNGAVAPLLDALLPRLPLEVVRVHWTPDGSFPNGVPNPLLPDNRSATREAVLASAADLGVAWDGDGDRCFFFDAQGNFVEGYYIVGLLARALLESEGGRGTVVHDPRLTWNTREIVAEAGGRAVQSKTGHAFIKERMRAEDALYGGEMSAHHYFGRFGYCDNGTMPWLLVAGLMGRMGVGLAEMVAERQARYPVSGEINRQVGDVAAVMAQVEREFAPGAVGVDRTDGLSVEHSDWRFNLRASNTEPLLRLNVETRGSESLMRECTAAVLARMDAPAPAKAGTGS